MPVYKDSNRKSWFVQLNITDFTGSHKSIKKRGFATKSEADAYEMKLKKRYGSVSSLTISEFYPIFIEDLSHGLRSSSLRTRKYCFEKFILPSLGAYFLREMTPDIIHEWQKKLSSTGLAASTLQQINTSLSSLFRHAMRYYGFSFNPVQEAGTHIRRPRHHFNIWSVSDLGKVLLALRQGNFETESLCLKILFFCGLRIGELMALTADNIHPDRKSMEIRGTFSIENSPVITAPKTKSSVREILVPGHLFQELLRYISAHHISGSQRIFECTSPYKIRNAMRLAAAAWHLPLIRIHDLRHSNASTLIHLGFTPFVVKNRLGHKSIQVTMDTYAQLFDHEEGSFTSELEQLETKGTSLSIHFPVIFDRKGSCYFVSIPDFKQIPVFKALYLDEGMKKAVFLIKKQLEIYNSLFQKAPSPSPLSRLSADTRRTIIFVEI